MPGCNGSVNLRTCCVRTFGMKKEAGSALRLGPILPCGYRTNERPRAPLGSAAEGVTPADQAAVQDDDDDRPNNSDNDARQVDTGHIGDLEEICRNPSADDGADDSEYDHQHQALTGTHD